MKIKQYIDTPLERISIYDVMYELDRLSDFSDFVAVLVEKHGPDATMDIAYDEKGLYIDLVDRRLETDVEYKLRRNEERARKKFEKENK